MAATELGQAYVQIIPSAKGISNKIKNELTTEGQSGGKFYGSSMVATIIKTASIAAIGKAISSSLKLGAELQQNLGGSEAVFGEFADTIQAKAKEAYYNMGLSQSDYLASANKMASLFQGSGHSQQKSLDLTTKAMQRAADVASVMGIDTKAAMEAIAGAAKGNMTMMDNLGVAMNATTLSAYALEKGLDFNWNIASNAEKTELAIKMFMEKTKQYAGNFAKESNETLSGSFSAFKSSFNNFLANLSLGNSLKQPLKEMIKSASTFLFNNLIPAIINVVKGIPMAIIDLFNEYNGVFENGGISMINSLIDGFFSKLPSLYRNLSNTLSSFITSILNALPSLIDSFSNVLNNFISTMLDKLPELSKTGGELIKNVVKGILVNLPNIIVSAFKLLSSFITTIVKNLPKIVQVGIDLIVSIASGIIEAVPGLLANIPGIILDIVNYFASYNWLQIGLDIIAGIGKGILDGIAGLLKSVAKAAQSIWDGITGFFGIHSPSRKMMWAGEMLDKGFAKGIKDHTSLVSKAMEDISKTTFKSFNSDINANAQLNYNHTNQKSNSSGINQTIIINSPESLNPSEIARQTKNATYAMALRLKGI